MADPTTRSSRTPWHLWVIAVVSLLWNAAGAFDFLMTQTRNAAYLKNITPAQLDYFFSFPSWVVIAWGVATWGSFFASLFLLLRKPLAVSLFVVSLVGMAITFGHNYVLTDGLRISGDRSGTLIFTAVIVVIGVLLLLYARAMRKRGVLG